MAPQHLCHSLCLVGLRRAKRDLVPTPEEPSRATLSRTGRFTRGIYCPNAQHACLNIVQRAERGPDRQLYVFPRLTARGNYSRIGIARVRFNGAGDPTGVERLGIALEPEADYELRPGVGAAARIHASHSCNHSIVT